MKASDMSRPVELKKIKVQDDFWKREIELVRKEVIPYQWRALNDDVPGAAPSFCMRNFKVAGKMNEEKHEKGETYVEPQYTFRGFEALPEEGKEPEPDKFYGFVFQDTDFSKWIEAVAYSLAQHPDEELEKTADEAIDIVCKAQADDGYLDTYYIINGRDKEFTNLRDHHELYCLGHLVEGAVAYYQSTGKNKLLNAAIRFADYVYDYFGKEDGKCLGYPGHEIAEMALVRLYEVTNNKKYLELSQFFIEERGRRPYYFDKENHPDVKIKGHEDEIRYEYNQAHKPVREQDEAVGHAVRAVYLYSGMADIARINQDEEMYKVCRRIWDNIVNKKMYITGGIGATHIGESFSFNYDLPNDTTYAETCASIGMAFFARRMLEIEADSRYADIMELEAYNGILSGMALDGKSFFYVNPLEVKPIACHKDERKYHVKPIRQKWFGCACCPPNIARFVGSIGNYAYTENEDTLFIHLYVGGQIEKMCKDSKVNIEIDSSLPWEGKVSFNVKAKESDFVLALRIPQWCDKKYTLEGFDGEIREEKGYLYLKKDWQETESFNIEFAMDVKVLETNLNVVENIGKVAVKRGPVVYCLEEADNGADLHLCMLNAESEAVVSNIEIEGNAAKKISLAGKRIINTSGEGLYQETSQMKMEDVSLLFVPYYMWANRGENEMQVFTRKIF